MRSLIAIGAALAAAAVLSGCGEDRGGEPQAIAFSRVGGLAGLSDRLEVEPDGTATVRRRVGGETDVERFELSRSQLDELSEMFDSAGFDETENPPEAPNCPDCFIYEITRGDHTVTANDADLPRRLEPVRDSLVEIVDSGGHEPIAYSRGGGMTGGFARLEIEPDGAATVTTHPFASADKPPSKRFMLSPATLRKLGDAFDEARFEELESPEPSGCADCISSVLSLGDHTVAFDNLLSGEHGSVHERLDSVLAMLDKIIDGHPPAGAPTRAGA